MCSMKQQMDFLLVWVWWGWGWEELTNQLESENFKA